MTNTEMLEPLYDRLDLIQARPKGNPDDIAIVMTSRGLGDSFLCLTLCEGIRRTHGVKVVFGAPTDNLPWLQFWDAYDSLVANPTMACREKDILFPYDSYQMELSEQSARGTRVEYYSMFCGPWSAPAMLPRMRESEAYRQGMTWASQFNDRVILCPFSHWHSRDWLLPNWLALERLLLREGYEPLILDTRADRVACFKSDKVIAETPARVSALIGAAKAVIGVDSGMIHLAGLLRTPAIALCGPTDPAKIFAPYPSVLPLSGSLPCSGCYWRQSAGKQAVCDSVCSSIQGISPERVVLALEDALGVPSGHQRWRLEECVS